MDFFDFSFPLHNSYKNMFARLRLREVLCLIGANIWYKFGFDICGADFTCLPG